MMTTAETKKLQGFPPTLRKGTATERQFRMMLGNAMTVPMFAKLQRMLLGAIGKISLDDVPDPCAS